MTQLKKVWGTILIVLGIAAALYGGKWFYDYRDSSGAAAVGGLISGFLGGKPGAASGYVENVYTRERIKSGAVIFFGVVACVVGSVLLVERETPTERETPGEDPAEG